MTRVTVDTNVLISALLFRGLPSEILTLATDGSFRLITSPVLLDELDEKLRLKFLWSKAKADEVREQLEALCDLVSTTNGPNVIVDDPDDDRVLECAIAGGADCIVSGDRHLLKLGVYVAILTVRQFIGRINPAV